MRIQEFEYQTHSTHVQSQRLFRQTTLIQHSKNMEHFENTIILNIEEIESSVVFFGNSSSGKTSIIHHIIGKQFNQNIKQTIGSTFTSYRMEINSRNIKLQIWDLPGEDRYRTILPSFYHLSKIGVFVFDSTILHSLDSILKWINEIEDTNQSQIKFIFVENKIDLIKEQKILSKEIQDYILQVQGDYCRVSAKTGEGIDALVKLIGSKAIQLQMLVV